MESNHPSGGLLRLPARRATGPSACGPAVVLLRPLRPRRAGELARLLHRRRQSAVRQNRYSVPVRLAGLRVRASVSAREITILHEGTEVARHERLRGRFSVCARLEHYLELLRRKPGALAGSLALHQEREGTGKPMPNAGR